MRVCRFDRHIDLIGTGFTSYSLKAGLIDPLFIFETDCLVMTLSELRVNRMKKICEIGKKISKIELNKAAENYAIKYAEKIFHILRPYVSEYRKLEFEYGFFPEYHHFHPDKKTLPLPTLIEIEDGIKKLSQHPFVCWINEQPGFITAKERISQEQLVVISNPVIERLREYRSSFVLEFICSLVIYHFTGDENKLSQAVVTQKKLKPIITAMRKLKHEFHKGGGVYFAHESKQHILQILLEETLGDNNLNIYSSAKNHSSLIRQVVTKKIMQSLFTVFGMQKISHTLVVGIALDITSIFFDDTMDRSDASIDAQKILKNLIEDNAYAQQSIASILATRSLELMKF